MAGNNEEEMTHLRNLLAREFEIKDLGKLRYFLAIEVARSEKEIFISQRAYILDLFNETGMLGCKPAESPIEANHKLQAGVGSSVDVGRYQRLVGRLICLAHTRPDIAYAAIKKRIGLVTLMTRDQPQVVVFLLEETWSHGEAKSRVLLQGPVHKLNIELWHRESVNFYGCTD
ncbi:uncharacterized mitochondrial protein AtMg00810-like [Jatropha curcas]|uniref:uncharacterized mitochondrial protein AtMg00810-like n=1 Tax=Jatropha curcas TaxID=180498 RepID=UPI0018962070|nr:uncharacterized mitochondrial protein AtMg00810-like [Jatropha curcas]